MVGPAFDLDGAPLLAGDGGDHTHRYAGDIENRTLLDVQLDERRRSGRPPRLGQGVGAAPGVLHYRLEGGDRPTR